MVIATVITCMYKIYMRLSRCQPHCDSTGTGTTTLHIVHCACARLGTILDEAPAHMHLYTWYMKLLHGATAGTL